MKRKLELQTILLLLCALVVAGSWIGVHIAKDSLGAWIESHELHFTTEDLLGLGPRSEVRCAGAVVGHVHKVMPGIAADGAPHFLIIAGVRREFASWRFAPRGIVKLGVVQSALSPSWINLDIAATPDGVQPRTPRQGPLKVLHLEREQSKNDLENIAERIDRTIAGFTEPRNGSTKSVMNELADAIHHLNGVIASLNGQSQYSAETELAKRPPIDRVLFSLDSTTDSLRNITSSLEKSMAKDGDLDQTLANLNASLLQFQQLTDEMSKTTRRLKLEVDKTLGKANSLLDETSATMSALEGKGDRLGDTFFGRMFIAKPDNKKSAGESVPGKATRNSRKPH